MQALVPPKFVRLFLILSDAFTKGSDTTIDSAVLLVPGYDLFQKKQCWILHLLNHHLGIKR